MSEIAASIAWAVIGGRIIWIVAVLVLRTTSQAIDLWLAIGSIVVSVIVGFSLLWLLTLVFGKVAVFLQGVPITVPMKFVILTLPIVMGLIPALALTESC